MTLFRLKKQLSVLLGYLSGFCFAMILMSNMDILYNSKKSKLCKVAIRENQKVMTTYLQEYKNHVSKSVNNINCVKIFNGDKSEIHRAQEYLKSHKKSFVSYVENEFVGVTMDCKAFKHRLGYKTCSKLERSFPLAFSIITHEHIEHVERLLRMVYCPQNIYCIHVDLKSSPSFLLAVQSLANCFPNVFLTTRRQNVVYAHISRLKAELNCIEDMLKKRKSWKYYLNLASSEIPLKTNQELVKVLKRMNGSNDIEEIDATAHQKRFTYKYVVLNGAIKRTQLVHPPPPHNLTITKGVAYGVFSRRFLEFCFRSAVAKDLLTWSQDTFSPDEHYWATLNNLHDNPHIHTPGGSKVPVQKTRYIARFVVWRSNRKRQECHGMYRHNICVFGLADLPLLITQNKIVANKFDLQFDPVAYYCMEQMLWNRSQAQLI